MSTPMSPQDAARIYESVTQLVTGFNTFKDEQIAVFTAAAENVTVTDSAGNPITVPSWHQVNAQLANAGSVQYIDIDGTLRNTSFGIIVSGLNTEIDIYSPGHPYSVTPAAVTNETTITADAQNENNNDVGGNWYQTGMMPGDGGKYWLILEFTETNQSSDHESLFSYTLQKLDGTSLLTVEYATGSSGNAAAVVQYTNGVAGSPTIHPMPAGVNNLLITFDFGMGTIGVYADSLIVSVPLSSSGTYWSGVFASGQIDGYGETFGMTFNVSDPSKSPFSIPAGYLPLTTLQTPIPQGTFNVGTYVSSQVQALLWDTVVASGEIYVLLNEGLKLLPKPYVPPTTTSGPQLDATNQWLKTQQIGPALETYGTDFTLNTLVGAGWSGTTATSPIAGNIIIDMGPVDSYKALANSTIIGTILPMSLATATSLSYCFMAGSIAGACTTGDISFGYDIGIGYNAFQVSSKNMPAGQSFSYDYNVVLGQGAGNGLILDVDNFSSAGPTFGGDVFIGGSCAQGATKNYCIDGTWPSLVMVGSQAGENATIGGGSVAIGSLSMYTCTQTHTLSASNITAVGNSSLANSILSGQNDTCIGGSSGNRLFSSGNCASLGASSLANSGTVGSPVSLLTAIGYNALASTGAGITNSTGVGANSTVTGSNQVQLGDSATTTYAYGAVQSRSDERDKTEIRDTLLGLDFINSLRAVDYKWDFREDYLDTPLKSNIRDAVKDGSKKRNRFHHGLIAQEVKATAEKLGVDFGGYQDHSINGGHDVKSLGYEEFIGPIIKAIQEVDAKVEALPNIDTIISKVVTNLLGNDIFIQKLVGVVSSRINPRFK